MARSNQSGEFNTFVGGLITEASPLTFPENASLDENNFVLERDGSRRRRLGMDLQPDGLIIGATGFYNPSVEYPVSTFEWENVGQNAALTFLVLQLGPNIFIHDASESPLGPPLSSFGISQDNTQDRFSYAVVDGSLIVCGNQPEITKIDYTSGGGLSDSKFRLKVRDQFGLEPKFDVSLLLGTEPPQGNIQPVYDGEYSNYRPPYDIATANTLDEDKHVYNLRNQGWGPSRSTSSGESVRSTIEEFRLRLLGDGSAVSLLPASGDFITSFLEPSIDAASGAGGNYIFNQIQARRSVARKGRAPAGHYIIDLLDRGQSRIDRVNEEIETNNIDTLREDTYTVSGLGVDRTPNGARAVAEYGGRLFFAGFSGEVEGGDERSPNLSSYLLFNKIVQSPADFGKCYQEGDPTDPLIPDLIDTDGGFIRVDGAYNILELVNVSSGLMIIAQNGIWFLSGADRSTFTANSQDITKVSERGCISSTSIVVVDNTVMYWGDDAIYHIKPNQVGDWEVVRITDRIRTYYQGIPTISKAFSQGTYDSYENKVRWVYDNTIDRTINPKELVLDLVLGAFYPAEIPVVKDPNLIGSDKYWYITAPIKTPPFKVGELINPVEVVGDQVQVGGEDVAIVGNIAQESLRETIYLTLRKEEPFGGGDYFMRYKASSYSDTDFIDFKSVDDVGVDAQAYLLTGYIGNGDYQRFKQVPYIYFHFRRTEDGFELDDGDLVPRNESSCLVQAQWDWANSAASGRWGKQFQAYRYRKVYMPVDVNDPYDYGFETIITRNKLRGKGRVVSMLIQSEPGKDMNLLGWSLNLNGNASY